MKTSVSASLTGSYLRSIHLTATRPSGVAAIAGKAWVVVVASSFTRFGVENVAPPSVERAWKTSARSEGFPSGGAAQVTWTRPAPSTARFG